MLSVFIFLIFKIATCSAQDWVQNTEVVNVENQEVLVEVKKDATYTWTEKDVLSVQKESSTISETNQKITFEPTQVDVQVVEFGIQDAGRETTLPLESIRKKNIGAKGGVETWELPFVGLTPSSRIWYKVRRTPKVHDVSGFFSMDLVYGFLKQENRGQVRIVSELPLYFQVNDPGHVLKIESKATELTVTLEKPVLSVGIENLRVGTQEELRAETPRVQVSTARNWSDLSGLTFTFFVNQLHPPMPQPFREIEQRLKSTGNRVAKVEKLLQWIGEEMTYTGPWHSETVNWRPRTLEEMSQTMSGDSKDLALLTFVLLKSAGVEAEPMYVGVYPEQDRSRYLHTPIQDKEPLPSTNYFNHAVVRYKSDEKWSVIDPSRGLAEAHRPPYYLNHAWAMPLNPGDSKPSKISLPEKGYASARIQTELVRTFNGEFSARSQVKFTGELSHFLKSIYFKNGESEFRKYIQAFAAVANPSDFAYRKLDFVDRSAKDFSVELTFKTEDSGPIDKKVLAVSPHYLPLFSKNKEALNFPAFPMRIDETTVFKSASVEDVNIYGCMIRGPLASLDRRIENKDGSVRIHDRIEIPGKEILSFSEESQIKMGAHVQRLTNCAKNAMLAIGFPTPGVKPVAATSLISEISRIDSELKLNPTAALWTERGQVVRQMGFVIGDVYIDEYLREAEDSLKKALELKPEDADAWGQLGITAFFGKEWSKALADWNKSFSLNGKSFAVLQLGGLLAERNKKMEFALSYFAAAAAAAQDPEDKAWALSKQADLLCDGEVHCPERLFLQQKILALAPRNPQRHLVAAHVYAKQGEFEHAVDLSRRAISLGDLSEARRELFRNLISASEAISMRESNEVHDYGVMRDHLLEAYSMDSKNPKVLTLLVSACEGSGDLEAAQRYLEELHALDSIDAELYAKLKQRLEGKRLPSSEK